MKHYGEAVLCGSTAGLIIGVAAVYLWLSFGSTEMSFPL